MTRIIAVTGGANGIGWATAQRFARGGDRVAIIDRDGEAATLRAAELGEGHLAIRADMAVEANVVAAIAEVAARGGRIDVLVNNAGIVDAQARPVLDQPLDEFRHLMAVNLEGSYVAAREGGRIMLAQGGGAIVNVASLAGVVAIPSRNGYSVSKAAVIGMTRSLACEWAGSGVRVNAVLPGYVATDIIRSLVENGKVDSLVVERRVPMGRMAEPAEIAAAVHHLASPEASYSAGALLAVDGGYQAFGGTTEASPGGAVRREARAGPRVVLITGGASGIGAATARRFAAQGDHVVILDRRGSEAMAAELGGDHIGLDGDVTDEADAARVAAMAMARFGRVDILINNAGIAENFAPTVEQTLERFRRVVDVDLTGALIMARAVAPGMIARGHGAIVNLASIAGIAGLPRRNAYCAAKAGIIMLTRSLACEWAQHGIRVNAVAPGYIATPGSEALEAAGHRDFSAVRRRTPMGRLGKPEEVAAAITYLASEEASYITGETYRVDGGWSAYGDAGPAAEV